MRLPRHVTSASGPRVIAVSAVLAALAAPALAAGLLVVLLAACAPSPSAPASPSAAPSSSSAAPPSATPSASTPSSSTQPPSPPSSPGPGAGVTLDPTLLALLPPTVDGVAVTMEPEAFAEAASDPSFVASVEAAAFPIAVSADDLASGVVALLRPGRFSDRFFRDWRDSYNEGACGQAGGVVGNAEAELDGRTVYITSCAGGLRVYHAHVAERDVIVSLFSVGERRFGEQLMKDLRP